MCRPGLLRVAQLFLIATGALVIFSPAAWRFLPGDENRRQTGSISRTTQGCSSTKPKDRVIVAVRCQEDTTWLSLHFPDIPRIVYQLPCEGANDHGTQHQLPNDNGHESQAILAYIVAHYDALPASMLFIHAHR